MEPPARESRMPPPPEHDIDDGGILNQHRYDNIVSLPDVRNRICDPRPAAPNSVLASRNDIENRQLMTAALNAVRHSLPHAAQTDQTDLLHSSQMGHGDRPDVPDIASQPGQYTASGCFDPCPRGLSFPILTQPSNKKRALRCGIESDRFLPAPPAIFFGRGAAWRTPTWHTS